MADIKFSQFANGGELEAGDVIVGLRGGVNTKFNAGVDPGGPFLLQANNLSDVDSAQTSLANLGLGSGQILTLTDGSFIGGIYTLPNPCPELIIVTCNTPGNKLRLPSAQGAQAFSLGFGPQMTSTGTAAVAIQLNSGAGFLTLQSESGLFFKLSNNATSDGAWGVISTVTSINNTNGNVTFTSTDGSIGIVPDATAQTIDLSATSVVIAGTHNIVWVGVNGSDITGSGTFDKPYASLSHAMASITTASSTNPFTIMFGTGTYTDTNVALKPWVYVDFNNSTITISGAITLDASWSGIAGNAALLNSNSATFPAFNTLNFNTAGALSVNFYLANHVNIAGASEWDVTGTSSGMSFYAISNVGRTNTFSYNIVNCQGRLSLGSANAITLNNCTSHAINYITVLGNTQVTGNTSVAANIIGVRFVGLAEYSQSGAGTTSIQSRGNIYQSSLILDNGTGGGNVSLDADSLKALPTLLHTTTYTPTYISDTSLANANFTPVNYTPTAGVWAASSVTGNLAGIDAAIAATNNVVYQQLYVNAAIGNDSNSGSILKPMATYDAARLKAISLSAGINNRFAIVMVGNFTIAGNMTLSPFISVMGVNDYATLISVSGSINLDAAWGTTASPFMMVSGINFIGSGNISLVYPAFQSGSFIEFTACAIQLGSITVTGAGTSTTCETVVFENCNSDGFTEPTYTATNVNLSLFDTNPSNTLSVSVTSTTSIAKCYIVGSQTVTGNVTLNATSTGTLTTTLGSSFTQGKTLTINGTSNTVNVDSSSYMFTLAFSGGAGLSNINTPSKSDGITAASYSPSNFSGIAGSLYKANSSTGYFAGIDAALGSAIQWKVITASQAMVPGQGYVINSGSVLTLTLPASISAGQVFAVTGFGTGGWIIAQNSGQLITCVNNNQTTIGATGQLASDANFPRSACLLVVVSSTTLQMVWMTGIIDVT